MSKYYDELLKLAETDEKRIRSMLFENYVTAIMEMKKTIRDYTQAYENLSFAKQMELKRLDNLINQMNESLMKLYNRTYDNIVDYDKTTFDREYFGVFYEVENIAKINLQFGLLNENYIMQAIEAPIEGLKLSERLYDKHLNDMKLRVKGAVTQGLINGSGYAAIAKSISDIGWTDYNHALTIAVTEAGRIKSMARQKGQQEATSKGVNLQKKWVATLDKRTRSDHQQLDGQVVGIDEEFHIHGYSAQQPRLFGVAKEDIRCRCDTVTIVEGISPELRRDNETKEVIEYKNYEEWHKKRVEDTGQSDIIKDNTSKSTYEDLKSIKEAEKWALENLNLKKISYSGISLDVANYVNRSVDNIYNEYPLLNGFIHEIKADGRAKAPASAALGYKHGELSTKLTLSKNDLSDLKAIDEMIERCVNDQWWSPKDGVHGIVKHEMGHMIEYALTLKKYGVINTDFELVDSTLISKAFDAIRNGEVSKEIKVSALSNLNITNTKKNVKENLSDYSNHSTLEFLAEAVSEDNPRSLATEAVKLLNRKIEEVWK